MFSHSYTRWLAQFYHPSDEDLLFCSDGELTARAAKKVHKHLARCWSCRARQEELEQSIHRFTKDREQVLNGLLQRSPETEADLDRRFRSKLKTLASEADSSPGFHPLLHRLARRTQFPRLSLRFAACLLASGFVLYLGIELNRVSPVSAHEVLQRTKEAEIQKIRQVTKPVVYQKLQIVRKASLPGREETVTWESWNDPGGRRFAQRVADVGAVLLPNSRSGGQLPPLPPLLVEIEAVFRANGLDARQPLSAAGYEQWRGAIQREAEEVVEAKLPDGARALALKTTAAGPHRTNGIMKAELVVRAQDWHAVEQRLQVQGINGVLDYQFAENAFEVLALAALPPSLVDQLFPTPSTVLPSPKSVALAPRFPSVAEAAEQSMAVEIQAHYALHQLKACLGKPLEVSRDPAGRVQINGLVNTPEERDELVAALRAVPSATVKIQTIEEAVRATASASASQLESESAAGLLHPLEQDLKVQASSMPLQNQLERYFASRGSSSEASEKPEGASAALEIAELSNSAITLSKPLMAEAWALRRLAESYSRDKTADLLPHPRLLLQIMVQDHLSGLTRQIERVRQLLEPILFYALSAEALTASTAEEAPAEQSPSPSTGEVAWNTACLEAFGVAEEVRGLVHGLFANEELSIEPEEAARRLLLALSQWAGQFRNLETKIARQLSGNSPQLSSRHDREPKP
ncbi:MAG: hypothetical protein L0312_05795 [Acidobacteria bacterium]|nr:hypothetical protein [Acidobacteriota bacterium]